MKQTIPSFSPTRFVDTPLPHRLFTCVRISRPMRLFHFHSRCPWPVAFSSVCRLLRLFLNTRFFFPRFSTSSFLQFPGLTTSEACCPALLLAPVFFCLHEVGRFPQFLFRFFSPVPGGFFHSLCFETFFSVVNTGLNPFPLEHCSLPPYVVCWG